MHDVYKVYLFAYLITHCTGSSRSLIIKSMAVSKIGIAAAVIEILNPKLHGVYHPTNKMSLIYYCDKRYFSGDDINEVVSTDVTAEQILCQLSNQNTDISGLVQCATNYNLIEVLDKLAQDQGNKNYKITAKMLLLHSKYKLTEEEALQAIEHFKKLKKEVSRWDKIDILRKIIKSTTISDIDSWYKFFISLKSIKGRTIHAREVLASKIPLNKNTPQEIISTLSKVLIKEKAKGFWYDILMAVVKVTDVRREYTENAITYTCSGKDLFIKTAEFMYKNRSAVQMKYYYSATVFYSYMEDNLDTNKLVVIKERYDAPDSNA